MMFTNSSEKVFRGSKLVLVGMLLIASTLILMGCNAVSGSSQVLDFSGNVEIYQVDTNQFDKIQIGQNMPFNQPLLTGENSWVRLGLFEDGSAVQAEEFSSLTFLNDEDEDGQPVARLRLDIGSVYLAPQGGMIYVETPAGIAFAYGPASVVQVSYDPQTDSGQVACLAGVCMLNSNAGGRLLAAGESFALGTTRAQTAVSESIEAAVPAEVEQQPEILPEPVEDVAVEIVEPDTISEPIECGPPEGWQVHTVGEGQYFDSLLGTYGVAVDEFQQANCLGDSTVIVPGMHLFVPAVELAAVSTAVPEKNPAPAKPQKTEPTPTPQVEKEKPVEEQDEEDDQETVETEESTTASETSQDDDGMVIEMRMAALETTRGHDSNPGMGWQYRGGEYPVTYPAEMIAYAPRAEISWKVLNPAEGVYAWSELDANLNYVVSQGKQFSFRVYTMRGEQYGGHQMPQWVVDKGAEVTDSNEPDYSNCVYQQEWGKFVNKLIARYDGNSDIAFIDIAGYGDFNEWSWGDQTVWDQVWADAYSSHTSGRASMEEMDSFARRVLADMFIGGSYNNHQCTTKDGDVETVSYSYNGFSNTQLLMPYGGTIQSSQYVHSMDSTVGLRTDCLGRENSNSMVEDHRLGKEIDRIWPNAPVVFETCAPYTMENAEYLLGEAHGSIVHDANMDLNTSNIEGLLRQMGYQYQMLSFNYSSRIEPGRIFKANMTWQNIGNAPSYPLMGQKFELHIYLYKQDGTLLADILAPANISRWLPASTPGGTPPTYKVMVEEQLPAGIDPSVVFEADVKIIDTRTGEAIWLPFFVPKSFDYK